MPNQTITSLTLSGLVLALMAPVLRGAEADPNNLLPWGDYEHGWYSGGGKKLANGSWDGITALEASTGTPWFSIRLDQKLFTSIRGQWLKLYFDSKGGNVGIIWMDVATRESAHVEGAGAQAARKDIWTRLAGTFQFPDKEMKQPTLLFYGGGTLYDNLRLYRLGTDRPSCWNRSPGTSPILISFLWSSTLHLKQRRLVPGPRPCSNSPRCINDQECEASPAVFCQSPSGTPSTYLSKRNGWIHGH